MKTKLFIYIYLLLSVFFAYVQPVYAQTTQTTDYSTAGVSDTIKQYLCAPTEPGQASTNTTNGTATSNTTINAAANDLSLCINKLYKFAIAFASAMAVFFIVIAGYIYMSSDGNQESVEKAKDIMRTSITALVILMGGYLLLRALNPQLIQIPSIQPPQLTNNVGAINASDIVTASVKDFSTSPTTKQEIPPSQETGCTASGTNSGGYYRFSQCSGSWANTPYGTCDTATYGPSTIGTSACGPSSLATVIYNYEQQGKIPKLDVDPGIIAKLSVDGGYRVCGNGTSYSMFPAVASQFGLTATAASWDQAYAALKNGTPVIAAMGPDYFTSGGHFVTFYGIDSGGNILVADSGPRNRTTATADIIKSQIKYAFIITVK